MRHSAAGGLDAKASFLCWMKFHIHSMGIREALNSSEWAYHRPRQLERIANDIRAFNLSEP